MKIPSTKVRSRLWSIQNMKENEGFTIITELCCPVSDKCSICWGLWSKVILWWIHVFSCYCFIILMYHAATAPVFLLTRMIYMHLLDLRCTEYVYILFKSQICWNYDTKNFFPAAGLVWKEELAFFFFFFVTKHHGRMNHVEFVTSVSSSVMFPSISPSSRPSVHWPLCISVCPTQNLSFICKLPAVAAHYVSMCVYIENNCRRKYKVIFSIQLRFDTSVETQLTVH